MNSTAIKRLLNIGEGISLILFILFNILSLIIPADDSFFIMLALGFFVIKIILLGVREIISNKKIDGAAFIVVSIIILIVILINQFI